LAEENNAQPVCFMVMPFGTKPTGAKDGEGPAEVDFDLLWEKALAPAIRALNYEAVRADEDLGALIINDMLERLTLADLVIADLTLSNANVYYEIGIRHGAKETGCVLISANWSKQLFDVAQMRQIRYPLPQAKVTDKDARTIIDTLLEAIPQLKMAQTPLYMLGFPKLDVSRSTVFRSLVSRLSQFQAQASAVRAAFGEDKTAHVEQLLAKYGGARPILPAVAIELLYLVRDTLPFERTLQYIDSLPEEIRQLPLVKEQRALAQSKVGDHLAAIGELESLIKLSGDSSERQGLLGGRYKRLYAQAQDKGSRRRYLDKAIEHYERGMLLDLNDYYPASNLPSLLRARGDPGDLDRARAVNELVVIACEAALLRKSANEWTRPTLLGAAFDAGDASKAEQLSVQVLREPPDTWKLGSMIDTLERSTTQVADPAVRARLEAVCRRLRDHLEER
jgi:tetratricopeptide (TPR) repeat protein